MTVSANEALNSTTRRRLEGRLLLLFAVVLFGMAVRRYSPESVLGVLIGGAALAAALWKLGRRDRSADGDEPLNEKHLLSAVLLFGMLGALGWASSAIGPSTFQLERLPGVAWIILAIALFLSLRGGYRPFIPVIVVFLTLVVTLVIGLLHLDSVEGLGLDVHFLHIEAARAITNGDNPYSDAVVVFDGHPLAEPGATITGYPYPPVAAISYALSEWTLSDPRYTSLTAWLLALTLVGGSAIRMRSPETVYLMLLLASIPGWPFVLRASWTEPLSLALLAMAFFSWGRSTASGAALGLGLASKQYFLVTAPVALLHREKGWLRRLLVAFAVAGITIGTALVLDFSAFWSAAVEFHSTTPPRIESANLVGLLWLLGVEWAPPILLSFGVGFVVAVAAGRLSRSRNTFVLAVALTLTASFLVSSQAFANYWFLVTGLCVLGLVPDRETVGPVSTDT